MSSLREGAKGIVTQALDVASLGRAPCLAIGGALNGEDRGDFRNTPIRGTSPVRLSTAWEFSMSTVGQRAARTRRDGWVLRKLDAQLAAQLSTLRAVPASSVLPVLIQPPSGGRLSGGYLYNRSMANKGAWRLSDVAPEALPSALEELSEAVVLADSLWLNDVHLPHFLRLKQRGARVGLVLHALPSMIAAADAGRPVSAEASAFELAGLKQFDFIVVLGQHFRDCLEQAGVPVVNCPPGVSTKFRFKPQARSTCCRFLSLAALTPLKGLCDAADIFSTWPMQPAFEWLVLGSTSVDPAYAARVQRRLEGKPHLRLLGQQSPDVVALELSQADVLVLPSYSENHPLVVLEAMAASVPVVAYAVGAVPHLLNPPSRGLTAAVGDTGALAAHLRSLCQDEERRMKMAQACYEYQTSLPDWKTAANHALHALQAQRP